MFFKIGVLKNFAIFKNTIFYIYRTPPVAASLKLMPLWVHRKWLCHNCLILIRKLKLRSSNWEKLEIISKYLCIQKHGFLNIKICDNLYKMYFSLLLFHHLSPLKYKFMYAVGNQISNRNYLVEFIKRRSKVHQKHVSCKRSLNFDQWNTFSENYESIKGSVMACLQNCGELLPFATFRRVNSNLKEV